MKHVVVAGLALAIAAAWQPAARADDLATAQQFFAEGKFEEARDLAIRLDTVEGLILAARTYSGQADCGRYERALYDAGLVLAERARDRDPANAEAWLQVAHNKGGRLRDIGRSGWLWVTGRLRSEIVSLHDAFDIAKTLHPDNPEPYLGLGSLQLGLLAAGRGHYIDATEAEALANFDRVFALDPDPRSAHYLFAKSLWDLDPGKHATVAREHAELALRPCKDGARCECTRQDARRLLDKMDAG